MDKLQTIGIYLGHMTWLGMEPTTPAHHASALPLDHRVHSLSVVICQYKSYLVSEQVDLPSSSSITLLLNFMSYWGAGFLLFTVICAIVTTMFIYDLLHRLLETSHWCMCDLCELFHSWGEDFNKLEVKTFNFRNK